MGAQEKFKQDYLNALRTLRHFISENGYKDNKGFHSFHTISWPMKLEKALGMPWKIKQITPGVSLQFTLLGLPNESYSRSGEIRFSSAATASAKDRLIFDNLARYEAAARLRAVAYHIHYLHHAIEPSRRPLRDPNYRPAIALDPDEKPSKAELKRRFKEAKKQYDKSCKEQDAQWQFYDNIIAQHDHHQDNGAAAFYKDMLALTKAEIAHDAEGEAYRQWFITYLEQKAAGKADRDILPLPLNFDFPEMPRPSQGPQGPKP